MGNPRMTTACLIVAIGLSIASSLRCVSAESSADVESSQKNVTIIELRPGATVDASVIRLGDIAKITGGDAALRDRLVQLDLEDALEPGESIPISTPQIEFRIRIAGLDTDRISIRGHGTQVTARPKNSTAPSRGVKKVAAKTSTPLESPLRRSIDSIGDSNGEGPLEREIVRAGRECILRKLPWSEENVSIRLAQPLSADVRNAESAAGYEFTTELKSSGPAVGRVQVRVVARAPQLPTIDTTFVLDVRHFDSVVLAKKSIDRGHTIAADDLYVDRQDVSDLQEYCSSSKELIGTTSKRAIRALALVRAVDFETQNGGEKLIVIKRRDPVRMTARVGVMTISATGEALQEGRVGEMIRLKNLDSNANVKGKVIGPGEVEIAF